MGGWGLNIGCVCAAQRPACLPGTEIMLNPQIRNRCLLASGFPAYPRAEEPVGEKQHDQIGSNHTSIPETCWKQSVFLQGCDRALDGSSVRLAVMQWLGGRARLPLTLGTSQAYEKSVGRNSHHERCFICPKIPSCEP